MLLIHTSPSTVYGVMKVIITTITIPDSMESMAGVMESKIESSVALARSGKKYRVICNDNYCCT